MPTSNGSESRCTACSCRFVTVNRSLAVQSAWCRSLVSWAPSAKPLASRFCSSPACAMLLHDIPRSNLQPRGRCLRRRGPKPRGIACRSAVRRGGAAPATHSVGGPAPSRPLVAALCKLCLRQKCSSSRQACANGAEFHERGPGVGLPNPAPLCSAVRSCCDWLKRQGRPERQELARAGSSPPRSAAPLPPAPCSEVESTLIAHSVDRSGLHARLLRGCPGCLSPRPAPALLGRCPSAPLREGAVPPAAAPSGRTERGAGRPAASDAPRRQARLQAPQHPIIPCFHCRPGRGTSTHA